MNEINDNNWTKISISKNLHNAIKKICSKTGLKMYFFENEAIKKYIKEKWPEYYDKSFDQ